LNTEKILSLGQYNTTIWEAETERLEFQAGLGYVHSKTLSSPPKKKKERRKEKTVVLRARGLWFSDRGLPQHGQSSWFNPQQKKKEKEREKGREEKEKSVMD
jgi:hypothetical protein